MPKTLTDTEPLILVIPSHIELSDITLIQPDKGGILVIPTYYQCEIFISIAMLKKLVQWGITNHILDMKFPRKRHLTT